jgi:hypothetical protein
MAANNASPPEDLTQETQALPRPPAVQAPRGITDPRAKGEDRDHLTVIEASVPRRSIFATVMSDWTDADRAAFARLLTRFVESLAGMTGRGGNR